MSDDIYANLSKTFEAYRLLDKVYEDLKKKKEIQEETKQVIKMFYEKPNKFIDVYLREERRKDGCRTYRDHKGKVRIIATGELEI